MSKSIFVTGGTGFIGQKLCHQLTQNGHKVAVLSRQQPGDVQALCGPVTPYSELAATRNGEGFDAVINLAGEGIADKRWSEQRKKLLRTSRIDLTEELVATMATWQHQPSVLVSGSAVGFYGAQGDTTVTEQTPPEDEFTHHLCHDWEQAALAAEQHGVRVCLSRTGLVVGPGGGFLQKMAPLFRLGLGGRLGSGQQFMPWVHRDDMLRALIWMMDTDTAAGPYNVVSPNPVTNAEFSKQLGQAVRRPALIPAPGYALKFALGEMSRLLLTGQRAVPARLSEASFRFTYPDLLPALKDALRA
ncbi:TIGR01777 family oxidoreductase [Marinobacter sp. X15-166B]|uniref:TIGR01777 family oxidoreductase n=1 Tax=Marinobacter sp. X15-166B TaxID=1897620 RepID=UPI00085BCD9B|nr:TIGR01777 family oxidoreductase [Marinobacter sp. X15-166B]OEY67383.1 TIGR01777 family protein [Marinobacter sp. X15-166B]